MSTFRAVLWSFALLASQMGWGAAPLNLADFESATDRIGVSEGREFPGARGRYERSPAAARSGEHGGRLHFDFSAGGRYVALILPLPAAPEVIADQANALEGWVRRPAGHELAFRYTDAAGQTFQRPIECRPDDWARIVVPFGGWTGHWGGANDGHVRGGPVSLALLVEAGEGALGQVDFDDLRLVWQTDLVARVRHVPYRFLPAEGWSLRAQGPAGTSRLNGRMLRLDYTQGAQSFAVAPPDRVLPGDVDQVWLRFYGSPRGLPVRLSLRTHFMTFHRSMGSLDGDGHLELTAAGPPAVGWEWSGGENDGRLHGPLRIGEIRFERPTPPGVVELELEEIIVQSSCPAAKRILVNAALEEGPEEPRFRFTARALTDEPMAGVVRWELRDWEGRSLHQGVRSLELPRHAAPASFSLAVPQADRDQLKFIEAHFQLELEGQEVPSAEAAWVAALESSGDARLQPDSPFGMGAYFYRYPGSPAGLAEMRQAAGVAQAAGVKWSREEFQWGRIEPQRGVFQWDFYDQMVSIAREHGIQVYAIVAYWAGWTRPYTAEGIDDYVRYLEALVHRYRRDIRHWEIWNEPNIFFWQGPKELYAELLKKSYTAVKAIDPKAEVLGLSTAGIDFPYIERMLELDAPFDILTIHPYRRVLNDRAFLNDLLRVSELVRRPDGTRRPVWLTELGWPTYSPHNTLRQDFIATSLRHQAELIVRAYLLAIGSAIEPRTFWYNFRNDGEDPFYFEHQMGIVDRQFRPKPAYRTYAVLTRMLDGLRPVRQLDLEADTFAWCFADDSATKPRRVTVAWNPHRDLEIELPVWGTAAHRINAVGEHTPLKVADGRITVPLRRGAAVYVMEHGE
jgi:hypothetical protein